MVHKLLMKSGSKPTPKQNKEYLTMEKGKVAKFFAVGKRQKNKKHL